LARRSADEAEATKVEVADHRQRCVSSLFLFVFVLSLMGETLHDLWVEGVMSVYLPISLHTFPSTAPHAVQGAFFGFYYLIAC